MAPCKIAWSTGNGHDTSFGSLLPLAHRGIAMGTRDVAGLGAVALRISHGDAA